MHSGMIGERTLSDFAHDLLAPLIGLRQIAALRCQVRAALLRRLLLLFHGDETIQDGLRFLFVAMAEKLGRN